MSYSYIVQMVYSETVDEENTLFGPFTSAEAARKWVNSLPDDHELYDVRIWTMNAPEVGNAHL